VVIVVVLSAQVQVVNQCELGVLTREQVVAVVEQYPELQIRLAMFARTGKKFSEKGRKKQQVSRMNCIPNHQGNLTAHTHRNTQS
jgi:hypothetical protein